MVKVCFSVDVEPDCLPYLKSCRGMEEGIYPLLEVLDEAGISGTFFSTGRVAEMYPAVIEEIVSRGHELGSHGYSHNNFCTMDKENARDEINRSTEILRKYTDVVAFRAPYLQFPDDFYPLLEEAGILVDSSQAIYKAAYRRSKPHTTVQRIPASLTSSALRLPRLLRNLYLRALTSPVVLFVHPWEFVDFRKTKLRWDCRFRTGEIALQCVREVLEDLQTRDASFYKLTDLAASL